MIKSGSYLVLLPLWLAGCASAPAVQPASYMPDPWVTPPRVYALIGEREELELTSQQITVLDSIGVALAEQNATLVVRVRQIQGADGGRPRRLSNEDVDSLRPLLEEIRDNNQAATDRVSALLLEPQERKACELAARPRSPREERALREREQREERDRRDRRMGQRDGVLESRSTLSGRAGGWPWCRAEASSPDTVPAG